MKVLVHLLVLLALCSTVSLAQEIENYLSKNKKEQFKYDYEKSDAEGSKLRDSWIAPINFNYNYTRSNPTSMSNPSGDEIATQSASIKINQPIFQSGGIYYGIKFADASKVYNDYSIDVAKKRMLKDTVALLMQIKQLELKEKKQDLRIKNTEINLAKKREQYISGQLDSSFLDSAILERNAIISSLYDMQSAKRKLISRFETLSDRNYKELTIATLDLPTKEEFLNSNLTLKMVESQIKRDQYNKDITLAKYLPKISFIAGYNWQKQESQSSNEFYDYGLRLSVPFNINTLKDIESSKVTYLKSKVIKDDKKIQLTSVYEQVTYNLDNFSKKQKLSEENVQIYEKLIIQTQDMLNAGYKTKHDLMLLQNSKDIQQLDIDIFTLDAQLELLTLYETY